MKKSLLLTLALVAAQIASAGDAFSNGFEGESFTADGWTAYSAGGTAAWTQIAYTSDFTFPNTIKTLSTGGTKVARSQTGGLNAIGKVNPSNWLISPQIPVGENQTLNFMMAYNASYNGNALVTDDEARSKFEILVSTTSADTTAFTQVLSSETLKGLRQFSSYNIDLSEYAGKNIYIAFHEYGTPTPTPWITNSLFIDNVRVTDEKKPDLSIIRAPKFKSGILKEQDVKVTVLNTGCETSSYSLNYQVGENAIVTEPVTSTLASGDSIVYTFKQKARFTQVGENAIKIWVQDTNDAYADNNSADGSATILDTAQIPYTLTTQNAETDFASSYFYRQGINYFGWFFTGSVNAWVYTNCAPKESYLFTTNGYTLQQGKLRIKTLATATTANAKMRVYLTKSLDDFGDPIAVWDMKMTLDAVENVVNIDIPESGDWIIALQPEVDGQVALFGLEISLPMEDMMPKAILSPEPSLVVNTAVPVTAKFRNDGMVAHENVKVSYQYGDNAAVSEYISKIEASSEIEYTFNQKLNLSTASTKTLKVWCSLEGDGNTKNDIISTDIYTYNAKTLPYTSSFETDDDIKTPGVINIDNDDVYWGIENVPQAIDGSKAFYLNTMTGINSNDITLSPALNIKKDTQYRVSFYWAKYSSIPTRESKLKVYLTTSPDAEGIASSTLLADYSQTENSYKYANSYFTVPQDGIYYIALYSENGTSDIILDDFRINQAEEVVMLSSECSETKTAFEFGQATVSAKFANMGMNNIGNIKLSYKVTGTDLAGKEVCTNTVNEEYTGTIIPGDTVSYTFNTPITFTQTAKYSILVSLSHTSDADVKNNNYLAAGPTLLETKSLPLTLGFEDEADRLGVSVNGKWQVGRSTPYEGLYSVSHTGAAAEGGDWIYLNRTNIPAGTYDLSFFWKTMTNNTNDNTRQSFAVYIGTEANPEAMTVKLTELTDTINADHKATKESLPLVIENSGNYFIGIKCTTTNTFGNVALDAFTIAEPTIGMEIPVTETYTADFADRENEWYHYHPANTSTQWKKTTVGDETYMSVDRTYTSWMKTWTTPGIYESPAFKLSKNAEYEVTFNYTITGTDAQNPLDGESCLNLYLADKNLPSAFTTLVTSGSEEYLAEETRGTATANLTVENDGTYWFGFIPSSNVSATFGLYSFSISNIRQVTGTENISTLDNATVNVIGNKLAITGGYICGTIYNINGMICTKFADSTTIDLSELNAGMYIVVLDTQNGTITTKIAVK